MARVQPLEPDKRMSVFMTSAGPSTNDDNTIVTLNCGGTCHSITLRSLRRYPDSLLAKMCDPNVHVGNEIKDKAGNYFIDRHPGAFVEVLNFYRTDRCEKPVSLNRSIWENELHYYELYYIVTLAKFHLEKRHVEADPDMPVEEGRRQRLWLLMEDPGSSMGAKIVSLLSLLAIVVSVSAFVIETAYDAEFVPEVGYVDIEPPVVFTYIEATCVIYFTAEYILRFVAARNPLRFLRELMNFIDLLAILPYYVTLAGAGDSGSLSVVRVIRLVRVFRVFKLGRHSSGLVVLGKTLKSSQNELLLLLFFLSMGVLLFATAIYYSEHGREGEGIDDAPVFKSIPHSFYWAVVTMTTLGYGDLWPSTSAGMVVASLCSISGVVMIALPMVVIGQNFADIYSQARSAEEAAEKAAAAQAALDRPHTITAFFGQISSHLSHTMHNVGDRVAHGVAEVVTEVADALHIDNHNQNHDHNHLELPNVPESGESE